MTVRFALSLFAFLLISSIVRGDGTDDDEKCDLKCYHNTTCVPGEANFTDHPRPDGQPLDIHTKIISPKGYRCDCPEGKTGLRCGRTYVGCSDREHKCYHGGRCIPGVADRFGNTQEFCDCSDAIDDDGVSYVGKYCEIPVPMPCGDSTDPEYFCIEGGHCKDNYEEEPHRPCRCGPERDGPHCEYAKGSVPNCTLPCENQGHCRLGFKTYKDAVAEYQDFWDDNYNGTLMHCACKDGFFGPRCEVTSETCNEKHCFNGATCEQVKKGDGTMVDHCNCATANSGGRTYSGKYCQYQATTFCNNWGQTESGKATFCLNGGECQDDGSTLECKCPDGFKGPICEFSSTESNTCNLPCENGGICRSGVKDYSFLNRHGIDSNQLAHIINMTHSNNVEHCVCPSGWTGLKCEVQVETCGEGEHLCLHGSTCIPDNGNYTCDCDRAFKGLHQFAGRFCQHKSTSMCTLDGKAGSGKNQFAFCVNEGHCMKLVDKGEEHVGCDCPKGFTGEHCEIREDVIDEIIRGPNASSGGSSGPTGVAIFFIVFAAIVVTVAAAFVFHRSRNAKEEIDPTMGEPSSGPPVLDMGPEQDLDGNELDNVEII